MRNAITYGAFTVLLTATFGCTSSTRIEWGGKRAVRNADGVVLTMRDGTPFYESEKNVYKDSNWLTRREERDLTVKAHADGSYEAALGSRVNDVSSNGVAMVTGAIDATTKLVSTVAAAYVTIAGGAQADAATAVAAKLFARFTSKGGNPSAATVTTDTDSKTLTLSDGTTCITCDAAGNCTDGACSP